MLCTTKSPHSRFSRRAVGPKELQEVVFPQQFTGCSIFFPWLLYTSLLCALSLNQVLGFRFLAQRDKINKASLEERGAQKTSYPLFLLLVIRILKKNASEILALLLASQWEDKIPAVNAESMKGNSNEKPWGLIINLWSKKAFTEERECFLPQPVPHQRKVPWWLGHFFVRLLLTLCHWLLWDPEQDSENSGNSLLGMT